jgi:uncharacterized protein YciI
MRYLAMLEPGPKWLPGVPVSGQDRAIIAAHLVAMRQRYDERALIFGGPFADGFGGMAVVEAGSQDEAAAMLAADPAVAAGLMTVRLHAVKAIFDAVAGTAWSPPGRDPS